MIIANTHNQKDYIAEIKIITFIFRLLHHSKSNLQDFNLTIHIVIIFQLVLERFWFGFGIYNSDIYFQNICHIPL